MRKADQRTGNARSVVFGDDGLEQLMNMHVQSIIVLNRIGSLMHGYSFVGMQFRSQAAGGVVFARTDRPMARAMHALHVNPRMAELMKQLLFID